MCVFGTSRNAGMPRRRAASIVRVAASGHTCTTSGERRETARAATQSCHASARSRPITRCGTRRPATASEVVADATPATGRAMLAATTCTSCPARTSSFTWFQAVHPIPGAPKA